MYPNFYAEYARNGLTLEKLADEMKKRGCKRTVPTISYKLNGKYPLTLDEAKILQLIVAPHIPIEILFETKEVE